jgi:hypothetical protein
MTWLVFSYSLPSKAHSCGSRNSVMLINQHLHVGVVVRQNWRVYRDRLSGEHGVVRMPETIIFPER